MITPKNLTSHMTILGTSILFVKGNNVHNQLRFIINSIEDNYFKALKSELDIIYRSDNTQINRDKLQEFIIKHDQEVFLKYTELGHNDFGYNLK